MAFRSEDQGKVTRLAPWPVTVDDSGCRATVVIPALGLDDLDRTGNIDICSIVALTSTARTTARYTRCTNDHCYTHYDRLTDQFYMFLAGAETTVSPELYAVPSTGVMPKLNIKLHLGHVGNSSLQDVATICDNASGDELARNTNIMVSVNKDTRKPTGLPDWWRQMYSSGVVQNQRVQIETLSVPETGITRLSYRVPWSDVDGYGHTSYLAYVRACLCAAMENIQAGIYDVFTGDILQYNIRRMRVLHANETTAGDVLCVTSWYDPGHPWTLMFDIRKGEKLIFQTTLEYYPKI